jgi:hypothetical protein
LATIKGEKTLAGLAQLLDVHPDHIATWKAQRLDGAAAAFGSGGAIADAPTVDLKPLHAKIGELASANGFCPARSARPAFRDATVGLMADFVRVRDA